MDLIQAFSNTDTCNQNLNPIEKFIHFWKTNRLVNKYLH